MYNKYPVLFYFTDYNRGLMLNLSKSLLIIDMCSKKYYDTYKLRIEDLRMDINKSKYKFNTDLLGDIEDGRKNLGETMPVVVYRILEYAMGEALAARFGDETCTELFRDGGRIAGRIFYEMYLSQAKTVNDLFSKWQAIFSHMKMGIVRVESLQETGDAILTMSEDLSCSGLPVIGETVCHYDEGFIEGLMNAFSGKHYEATEIDCWAKGGRVCRFMVKAGV